MWRSLFDMFTAVFTTVTCTMGSVQKGLDIGNDYVDNQHKALTRGFKQQAILDTAEQHARIQVKLEADDKLAELFKSLEAEW